MTPYMKLNFAFNDASPRKSDSVPLSDYNHHGELLVWLLSMITVSVVQKFYGLSGVKLDNKLWLDPY